MYGMKSVNYGFPLERWLKVKMSLICKVRHIFRQLPITPKTVVYIGQRCVYWVVYEASCRVNWTNAVYFITYNTGTNIHAHTGTNLHNGSSFCKHRWEV